MRVRRDRAAHSKERLAVACQMQNHTKKELPLIGMSGSLLPATSVTPRGLQLPALKHVC
jgi:hypothetical protein